MIEAVTRKRQTNPAIPSSQRARGRSDEGVVGAGRFVAGRACGARALRSVGRTKRIPVNVAGLVIAAIGVAATVGGLWVTWLMRRHKKREVGSWDGRREHRLGRRTPLTLLAAPIDSPASRSLVDAIGHGHRVPLQLTRPRLRPRALWLWFRRTYTVRETEPKSGFPIESWKYVLGSDPEVEDLFRHGSGFVLEFRLAAGENGNHLMRSATSQARAKERMVAVASAAEAVDPEAMVRCLLVDAETLRLAESDPRYVVVLSADRPKRGQQRVFQRANRDIPEDALWLVHPTPAANPTAEWGNCSEELSYPEIGPSTDWQDRLKEARRRALLRRLKAVAKHAAFWGYWFGWAVYEAFTSPEGSLDRQVWGSVAGSLLLLAAVVAGTVVVAVVRETVRTAQWFGGQHGAKRAWMGGTMTATELGTLLNSRGTIPWRLWRQHVKLAGRTASSEGRAAAFAADKPGDSDAAALEPLVGKDAEAPRIAGPASNTTGAVAGTLVR